MWATELTKLVLWDNANYAEINWQWIMEHGSIKSFFVQSNEPKSV